jgi:hypothetical protein
MEKWNSEMIKRLYKLYQQHDRQLRKDVAASNRSLGSANPEKTKLKQLTLAEFTAILKNQSKDDEVVSLWVRRIIRGHENEFPSLLAAG